ncbi:hypothetical protein ACQ3I4_06895 [Zafaria sp. Z1313]|uniref:hypothetical protein n=1 Tax=Zafaria sp. Z1313 TaxID=3423202 RepID=UPI003D30353F
MATAAPRPAAARTAPLRLRYDRLAVAGAGAVSLLAFPVTGILALAGVVSGVLPLAALALAVASFVALRALAVRSRRRRSLARMEAAFAEAMSAVPAPAPRRETELFDAQPARPAESVPTLTELRAEARRVAAGTASATWDPVEVPRPAYVSAAKAERPAPAPLPVPEQKKPQHVTSILADTRVKVAESAEQAAGRTAVATVAPARPQQPRINLDAVLQRRRA